jgi:hypothetical protein
MVWDRLRTSGARSVRNLVCRAENQQFSRRRERSRDKARADEKAEHTGKYASIFQPRATPYRQAQQLR